ncbi:MAG: sigma 54-interacting transcriptional regulator [Deltaproteobacteria bacterium]|nr:sigma 54-interacting transcriptional regulator [Deltaproteobacteria bacterium]
MKERRTGHPGMGSDLPPEPQLFEQLEALFRSSHDGIWICDGEGKVLRLNPASEAINDIRAEEWIGRNIGEVVAEGIIDSSVTLEVLKKGCPVTMFQQAKRTNKKLLVTGNPIFKRDGSIALVVTNDRDITELDNLRLKLEDSEARRERFQQELIKNEVMREAGDEFVCRSLGMHKVLATVIQVARFKSSVMIAGPSGTGKSVLARLIHKYSDRAERPFVRVECGAIPPALFESEVFGYERGAFTGADAKGKLGLFEMAHGGTLFLDEVALAPYELQHKLLRFLESGEIFRVGSTKPLRVDARVIAASNMDLEDEVASGRFRGDLYYRLKVVPLTLPPLKDRSEDIPFLVKRFLERLNKRMGTDKQISGPAVTALCRHEWPGNVRELENLIERLVVMSPGRIIGLPDLPEALIEQRTLAPLQLDGRGLREAVRDFEGHLIDLALERYGSQIAAAKVLKVSPATITRKRRRRRN